MFPWHKYIKNVKLLTNISAGAGGAVCIYTLKLKLNSQHKNICAKGTSQLNLSETNSFTLKIY